MEGAKAESVHLAMVDVFEDKKVVDNEQKGGKCKKLYFSDLLDEFDQTDVVEASPIPQGLKELLAETRLPFKIFYSKETSRTKDSDRREKATVLEDLKRPSFFFENVWKPIVYNSDAWLDDNDPADNDDGADLDSNGDVELTTLPLCCCWDFGFHGKRACMHQRLPAQSNT